jgi:hypothetical protein
MLVCVWILGCIKFGSFDAEEILGLANIFSQLIESFEKLQVSCALVGGDVDAVLYVGQYCNLLPKKLRKMVRPVAALHGFLA